MQRLRLDVAYDGTDFHGWAKQPALRTVQGELERALATALRVSVSTTCAGRTDTGVHAVGQVVHADVEPDALQAATGRSDLGPYGALQRRLNGLLPPDVRVPQVVPAPADFDARFSALWRRYRYRLADRSPSQVPLRRHDTVWWGRALDVEAMNDAATILLGEHDFASFCKKRLGASTVRALLDFHVQRNDEGVVETHLRADAFCHHMVRSLMGGLVVVGEGRERADWLRATMMSRARDPRIAVLPAHGLTFMEVAYPDVSGLAAQGELTRRYRGEQP